MRDTGAFEKFVDEQVAERGTGRGTGRRPKPVLVDETGLTDMAKAVEITPDLIARLTKELPPPQKPIP